MAAIRSRTLGFMVLPPVTICAAPSWRNTSAIPAPGATAITAGPSSASRLRVDESSSRWTSMFSIFTLPIDPTSTPALMSLPGSSAWPCTIARELFPMTTVESAMPLMRVRRASKSNSSASSTNCVQYP